MELLEELTAIGFTEYEAKVYLALLQEHPATGYQLSKSSGVPRSMVYETLKRLHRRGAALETIEGRSTLYRPLSPQVLLDRYEKEQRRRVKELREGLGVLYRADLDDRVWTISGRSTVLAYARQMLQEAEEETYLVLGDDALSVLEAEIEEASSRGLALNTLLTGEGQLEHGRVARHPPLESELQELTDLLLVAVEGGEMLVASAAAHRQMTATVTRDPDMVFIARQFVWMELFTQRIYARIGSDLLERLDPEDREIFESLEKQ